MTRISNRIHNALVVTWIINLLKDNKVLKREFMQTLEATWHYMERVEEESGLDRQVKVGVPVARHLTKTSNICSYNLSINWCRKYQISSPNFWTIRANSRAHRGPKRLHENQTMSCTIINLKNMAKTILIKIAHLNGRIDLESLMKCSRKTKI